MENYYLYVPISVIPVWYCIYSLRRLKVHWRDGRDTGARGVTRFLLLKIAIALMLFIFTFIEMLSIIIDTVEVKIFYILFTMSSGFSLLMLYTEYNLRLTMKWEGHRSYLILSFLLWVALFIVNLEDHMKNISKNIILPKGLLFALCVLLSFFLAAFGVLRPNEFLDSPIPFDKPLLKSQKASYTTVKSLYHNRFVIKIMNFKQKEINNKSAIIYQISVSINNTVHFVKKSYEEFEVLNSEIRCIFPSKTFPNFEFPHFPNFSKGFYSTDAKMAALNEYLINICRIEFMNDYFLDFFKIIDSIREEILEEHREIIEAKDVLMSKGSSTTGFLDLSVINFDRGTYSIEQMRSEPEFISNYAKINLEIIIEEANKVVYKVNTESILGCTQVLRQFSDFLALHSSLKSKLNKQILPSFPKKSYFKLISKLDMVAAETRRKKLENYLKYVCNDPAYHITELFDFINIPEDITKLWSKKPYTYQICRPIEWETEINNVNFIIFIITIQKKFTESLLYSWQIRRYYKDIEYLHKLLLARRTSSSLSSFYSHLSTPLSFKWPELPNNITGLSTDIESFRESLESYLYDLFSIPLIEESSALVNFVNDIHPYIE